MSRKRRQHLAKLAKAKRAKKASETVSKVGDDDRIVDIAGDHVEDEPKEEGHKPTVGCKCPRCNSFWCGDEDDDKLDYLDSDYYDSSDDDDDDNDMDLDLVDANEVGGALTHLWNGDKSGAAIAQSKEKIPRRSREYVQVHRRKLAQKELAVSAQGCRDIRSMFGLGTTKVSAPEVSAREASAPEASLIDRPRTKQKPLPVRDVDKAISLLKTLCNGKTKAEVKARDKLTIARELRLRSMLVFLTKLRESDSNVRVNTSKKVAWTLLGSESKARSLRRWSTALVLHGSLPNKQGFGNKWLINDERFRAVACSHLRRINGVITARKALSAFRKATEEFTESSDGTSSISIRTVLRWLAALGYSHGKIDGTGVYYDGHERPDVLEARKVYVDRASKLLERANHFKGKEANILVKPVLYGPQRRTLFVWQDETTVNQDQHHKYGYSNDEGHGITTKIKNAGRGIMISGYISEDGPLAVDDKKFQEALTNGYKGVKDTTEYFEYGSGNYWTAELHLKQLQEKVLPFLDYFYKDVDVVLVFDNSTCHGAYAPEALKAERMNLKDGGKLKGRSLKTTKQQWDAIPRENRLWKLRDTEFKDHNGIWVKQKMVTEDGKIKGMLTVLTERGIEIPPNTKMCCNQCVYSSKQYDLSRPETACCVRRMVTLLPDFQAEQPLMAEVIQKAGHTCLFLPKFHCELNPIEMAWAIVKRTLRDLDAFVQYDLLKREVPNVWLGKITPTIARKLIRHSNRILYAYRDGLTTVTAIYTAKMYKGHRFIPEYIARAVANIKDVGSIRSMIRRRDDVLFGEQSWHDRVFCDEPTLTKLKQQRTNENLLGCTMDIKGGGRTDSSSLALKSIDVKGIESDSGLLFRSRRDCSTKADVKVTGDFEVTEEVHEPGRKNRVSFNSPNQFGCFTARVNVALGAPDTSSTLTPWTSVKDSKLAMLKIAKLRLTPTFPIENASSADLELARKHISEYKPINNGHYGKHAYHENVLSVYKNGWLSDDVINDYIDSLTENLKEDCRRYEHGPTCVFLRTHFALALSKDQNDLAKSTIVAGAFLNADLTFIPVNEDQHWYLVVYYRCHNTFVVYESLGRRHCDMTARIRKFITSTYEIADVEETVYVQNLQDNYYDCGVFLLQHMNTLSLGLAVEEVVHQKDMQQWRSVLGMDIANHSFKLTNQSSWSESAV